MRSLPLSLSDLIVTGDGNRMLLSIDNLSIQPGETVGIRGPSGAGKTTLLFALAGLAKIKSGTVKWGDKDLSQMQDEARARFRRHAMGLIFQDFLLFEELDALSNAAIATGYLQNIARGDLRANAAAALDKLKIREPERRTIASFSGGERQRVGIARALAHNPAIILADEPTASLDRTAADTLIEDLVSLVREEKKTMVVVSHDPHLHERMDRVIEIVDGVLVGEANNA